jgi:hypothetical protein
VRLLRECPFLLAATSRQRKAGAKFIVSSPHWHIPTVHCISLRTTNGTVHLNPIGSERTPADTEVVSGLLCIFVCEYYRHSAITGPVHISMWQAIIVSVVDIRPCAAVFNRFRFVLPLSSYSSSAITTVRHPTHHAEDMSICTQGHALRPTGTCVVFTPHVLTPHRLLLHAHQSHTA